MLTPQPFITCSATPYGYEILVTRNNNVIEDYSAGNCAQDSIEIVPLNDTSCLSLTEIKRLARRIANEIAAEYNISRRLIQFDN